MMERVRETYSGVAEESEKKKEEKQEIWTKKRDNERKRESRYRRITSCVLIGLL